MEANIAGLSQGYKRDVEMKTYFTATLLLVGLHWQIYRIDQQCLSKLVHTIECFLSSAGRHSLLLIGRRRLSPVHIARVGRYRQGTVAFPANLMTFDKLPLLP